MPNVRDAEEGGENAPQQVPDLGDDDEEGSEEESDDSEWEV